MPRIMCPNDHVKADDGLPCERCKQIQAEQEADAMPKDCGCHIYQHTRIQGMSGTAHDYSIAYCPLHQACDKMREVLEIVQHNAKFYTGEHKASTGYTISCETKVHIDVALALAEGRA